MGSGLLSLLSLQGTSLAFLGAILTAGIVAKARGDSPEQILALIFGLCLAGCLVEIVLSLFIHKLERIITPTVTGIVITVIGLSLVKVGVTEMAGGVGAENFGALHNLALALVVTAIILATSFARNAMVRLSAMRIGLLTGLAMTVAMGMVDFSRIGGQPLVAVPEPFKFGLAFDWALFVPIAFIYQITAIETTGDLTANAVIAGQPVKGPVYLQRIRGGVLGDGIAAQRVGHQCPQYGGPFS